MKTASNWFNLRALGSLSAQRSWPFLDKFSTVQSRRCTLQFMSSETAISCVLKLYLGYFLHPKKKKKSPMCINMKLFSRNILIWVISRKLTYVRTCVLNAEYGFNFLNENRCFLLNVLIHSYLTKCCLKKKYFLKSWGVYLLFLIHYPVKVNIHDGYFLTFGVAAATTIPVFGRRGGMRSNVALP